MIKFVKNLFTRKKEEVERVEEPLDEGKFVIFKNVGGEFMFRFGTKEMGSIMTSNPYTRKRDAKRAIETVKERVKDPSLFEIRTAKDGYFYFVLKSRRGMILCTSGRIGHIVILKKLIYKASLLAPESKTFESILDNK